ncbi:MAG TPA: DUF177 domain-containing protein [Dehalococcoidia bacterium]|nr:DUF177 domain-containing protein [Dehalococcoidia bacterium]
MRINVQQMLQEPVGTRTRMELQVPRLRLGDEDVRDLMGCVDFLRSARGLLMQIAAAATGHGHCSRCLEEIDYPLRLSFEDEYLPTADAATGAPLPVSEDEDESLLIDASFDINLDEVLRQYKLLADPLKLLCQPDCHGLCPVCGQNWNKGECECQAEADTRWDALSGLQSRLRREERS